jgi:two-component system OmpR family response regulator
MEANLKPVVLIVEDEADIASLLANALESEGYEVLSAGTTAEFKGVIADTWIDLFLLDVTLPDGSGLGLGLVKGIRRVSEVGVILITGRADEVDQVVGLEIGADDYIAKPFRLRELRARVNSVHRRTRSHRYNPALPAAMANGAGRGAALTFGEWRLYPAARRLTDAEDREVHLTTAEFDLLAALLRNRNRVLTRDQIMNAVKGQDWASYDRVVDGLVSRLRGKLPVDCKTEHFIKTVRGVGYMFSD